MLTGDVVTITILKIVIVLLLIVLIVQACIHTDLILNIGGIFYIINLYIAALLNSNDTVVNAQLSNIKSVFQNKIVEQDK